MSSIRRLDLKLTGDKEFMKALAKLQGKQTDKALRTAFNRTKAPIPGYMARAMAGKYTAPQRELKAKTLKPEVKGFPPSIQIRTSSQPLSGRLFRPLNGVRWRDSKGASILVFKGGKRVPRERSFRNPGARIKTMAEGTPFFRKTSSSKSKIGKVSGPSFHHAFTGGKYAAEILDEVENRTMDKLNKQVHDALRAQTRGFIK